ncbi:RNA polymerase sigma factor [Brevibacillus laterosporus]|uniref:RNA polymerase sigma factor n=2 Tax=Brevibacillus laterosporus TaxID=1465 RepID=UPI000E6C0BF8|nr:RNA polymerase sigma factor [Brevibacillus laterosporus]AYB38148.1 RNA polymerase sigma factor [Brevibacillus laterosporus]MBM7110318.1 ECF RNA polymerase sigma factor SigE [Brevibacillus laterosporus]NKQ22493.1 RNA polymerase sigma factor [Brevibacillus laterosporus]WNX29169.1 RNA polymerase sigma factor [Brevibacillus laterosporus]
MENNSLLRTDKELAELYQRHADLVYRLCYIYLKNPVDAEDAVQSVFIKLIKSQMIFNDYEHEKAWLMVTTRNYCKDILKNWWKTRRVVLDALPEVSSWNGNKSSGEVLARLLSLPEKYKTVLYLYYFEEYSVKEISEMLGHKESTIQTQLSRGRKLLKIDLGGNYLE